MAKEAARIRLRDGAVDLGSRAVLRHGRPSVRLTPKEAHLLEVLVRRAPEAVSRDALFTAVWGPDTDNDARTVKVTLARLRAKIESNPADPVHVVTDRDGYRFVPAAPEVAAHPVETRLAPDVREPGPRVAGTSPQTEERGPATAPVTSTSAVPRDATPFVDRPEAAVALSLLDRARIVSLVGPAGSGKSRLADALAARVAPRPVVWCPLASVGDAGELVRRISPPRTAGPPALIVLDDAEHLVGPLATGLKRWVATDPGLTWLVTTREPLRVAGEAVVAVAGLAVPEQDTPAAAAASPAVALLVERLRAARGDFVPSEADLVHLGMLARRLDGLPLALELAAGRGRLLGPAALLRRCDDRLLDLLASDRRDLPARSASMRGALGATWDRLSPWEREAVVRWARQLPAAVGLDVAEAALVGIPGAPHPLDVVQALLDRALLVATAGVDGESRLSLPWPTSCYARERSVE